MTKTTTIIMALTFMIAIVGINADVVDDPWSPSHLSYLFHLYYDNGQLFADRDFEFAYDIIAEEFVPETYNTQFPFKGEMVTFSNQIASTFLFDPRRGDPDFREGKISVKAPYAPNGQKVVFYNAEGRVLLTIFVSESSFCNEDGICNADRGENNETCSNDCPVLPTANGQRPTTNGGGQNGMLMSAIYVLIIAGVALGGWFGWKWWKGRQTPPIIPPTLSTPQLP